MKTPSSPRRRRPSTSSSSQSTYRYHDPSSNDLTTLSASLLIVADCLGTGILALPGDVHTLGLGVGLTFLILNLPINWYAGTILGKCAGWVEERLKECARVPTRVPTEIGGLDGEGGENGEGRDGREGRGRTEHDERDGGRGSFTIDDNFDDDDNEGEHHNRIEDEEENHPITNESTAFGPQSRTKSPSPTTGSAQCQAHRKHKEEQPQTQRVHPSETYTSDFLGLTTALYSHPLTSPDNGSTLTHLPTIIVTFLYYTNLFLVLGNYILVMSHAVRSMLGEETICLPTAGIMASVLMYALSQLRTMASLGRGVSVMSLICLFGVVVICLRAIRDGEVGVEDVGGRYLDGLEQTMNATQEDAGDLGAAVVENGEILSTEEDASPSIARQLAAFASIGFAVGSQKLLLNIRHEMAVREHCAPRALGVALGIYGAVYVTVCVLAGPNPPSLLFDAIDEGPVRKVAGFLLWLHVAVSYAINSQALTSSLDRVAFHRISLCGLAHRDRLRWAVLTALISGSSFVVANAVPFFKDLVALIGALTSVPLTLLLPAVLYRRVAGVPPFVLQSRRDLASYLLVIFSIVFLLCGLFGALDSIEMDWESLSAGPFSCD